MAVTQYIGARYVPLFADPLQWDNARTYEPLTIVQHQGNSYTSRQAVPAGIDITNESYWALTGNYNAQIEQYRQEVQTFDDRITANTTKNTEQDREIAAVTSTANKNKSDLASLENDYNNTKRALINKNVLLIGDSYTNSSSKPGSSASDTPWVTKFKKNCPNFTVYNYAASGSGVVKANAAGYTFITCLNEAIDDLADEEIDLIIIYGGINDANANLTGISSAVTSLVKTAQNKWPDAQCHVFACNWMKKAISTNNINYYIPYWISGCFDTYAIVHTDCYHWLFREDYYASDGYHPSDDGYSYIELRIRSAINGSTFDTTNFIFMDTDSNGGKGTLTSTQFPVVNGVIVFGSLTIHPTSSTPTNESFILAQYNDSKWQIASPTFFGVFNESGWQGYGYINNDGMHLNVKVNTGNLYTTPIASYIGK